MRRMRGQWGGRRGRDLPAGVWAIGVDPRVEVPIRDSTGVQGDTAPLRDSLFATKPVRRSRREHGGVRIQEWAAPLFYP